MVLGGLWHGAAWPFVLWGVYQGGLLVAFRWVGERWQGSRFISALERPVWKVAGWAVMFHLTCYGWLIFRADSAGAIGRMSDALVRSWDRPSAGAAEYALQLLFYAGPLAALHAWEARRGDLEAVPNLPVVTRYAVFVALAYLTLLFGEFGGSQFIYFQF
jgi:alginate O-acetyltransferase complex protein AlgI